MRRGGLAIGLVGRIVRRCCSCSPRPSICCQMGSVMMTSLDPSLTSISSMIRCRILVGILG